MILRSSVAVTHKYSTGIKNLLVTNILAYLSEASVTKKNVLKHWAQMEAYKREGLDAADYYWYTDQVSPILFCWDLDLHSNSIFDVHH